MELPLETPITEVSCRWNSARVWIQTHMDVDWGIDAKDRDYLRVLPTQDYADVQPCGATFVVCYRR